MTETERLLELLEELYRPKRRLFYSNGYKIWTGDEWWRDWNNEWRTSTYRFFRLWSPFDWMRMVFRKCPRHHAPSMEMAPQDDGRSPLFNDCSSGTPPWSP